MTMERRKSVEDRVFNELKNIFPDELQSALRDVIVSCRGGNDASEAGCLQRCVNHILLKQGKDGSSGGNTAVGSPPPPQSSSTVSSSSGHSNNGTNQYMVQQVENMFPDADRQWILTSLNFTQQCFSDNAVDRTCNYMLEFPNRYKRKADPGVSSSGPSTPKLRKHDSSLGRVQSERRSNVLCIDREFLDLGSDSSDDDLLPSIFSKHLSKLSPGASSATVTSAHKLSSSSESETSKSSNKSLPISFQTNTSSGTSVKIHTTTLDAADLTSSAGQTELEKLKLTKGLPDTKKSPKSLAYRVSSNTLSSSASSSISDTKKSSSDDQNSLRNIKSVVQSQNNNSLPNKSGKALLPRSLSDPDSAQRSAHCTPVFSQTSRPTVSSTDHSLPLQKSPVLIPDKNYEVHISPTQSVKLARKLSALKGQRSLLEYASSTSQPGQANKRLCLETGSKDLSGQFKKKTSAQPRPVPIPLSTEPVSSSMQFETPSMNFLAPYKASRASVEANRRHSAPRRMIPASSLTLATPPMNSQTPTESVGSTSSLKKKSVGMTSLKRKKLLDKIIAISKFHKNEQNANRTSEVSQGTSTKLDPVASGSRDKAIYDGGILRSLKVALSKPAFKTLISTPHGRERLKLKIESLGKNYDDTRRNAMSSELPKKQQPVATFPRAQVLSKPISQSKITRPPVGQSLKALNGCSVTAPTVSTQSTPIIPTTSQHQTTAYQYQTAASQHLATTSQHQAPASRLQATASQHQTTTSRLQPTASQHRTTTPKHQPTTSKHQATTSQHQPTTSQHQATTSKDLATTSQHQNTASQNQIAPINNASLSYVVKGGIRKKLIAFCKNVADKHEVFKKKTVAQPSTKQDVQPSGSRGHPPPRFVSQPNAKRTTDSSMVQKGSQSMVSSTTCTSSKSSVIGRSLPVDTKDNLGHSEKLEVLLTACKDYKDDHGGKSSEKASKTVLPRRLVSSQVCHSGSSLTRKPNPQYDRLRASGNSLASEPGKSTNTPTNCQPPPQPEIVQRDQRPHSENEQLVLNPKPDEINYDTKGVSYVGTTSECKKLLRKPKVATSYKITSSSNSPVVAQSEFSEALVSHGTPKSRLYDAVETCDPHKDDLICTGVTCSDSNKTAPSTSKEATQTTPSSTAVWSAASAPLICDVTVSNSSPKSQDTLRSPDSTFKPLQVVKEDATSSQTASLNCEGCSASFHKVDIYQCCEGHVICTKCLEKGAKQVLSGESQGNGIVLCACSGCSSSIPRDNLARALPSMIMDLLDEKWTKETLLAIGQSKNMFKCPSCDVPALVDVSVEVFTCLNNSCGISTCRHCHGLWSEGKHEDCGKTEKSCSGKITPQIRDDKVEAELSKSSPNKDYPSHWTETKTNGKIFVQKLVQPSSKEWAYVRNIFAKTLPEAKIRYINRVQNYRLWKKYSVTRQNMLEDNGADNLNETLLFHGTRETVVDNICRDGFDWRMCGRNGVVYGQGAYFARTAKYSHKYSFMPLSNSMSMLQHLGFSPVPYGGHSQAGLLAQAAMGQFAGGLTNSSILGFTPAFNTMRLYQGGSASSSILTKGNLPISSGSGSPTPGVRPGTSTTVTVAGKTLIRKSSLHVHSSVSGPNLTQPAQSPAQVSVAGTSTTTHHSQSGQQISNNNQYTMFLARVLVGRPTIGKQEYRKPPVDNTFGDGRTYDSCVNTTAKPHIFVIFDTSQAYPDYVIRYTV